MRGGTVKNLGYEVKVKYDFIAKGCAALWSLFVIWYALFTLDTVNCFIFISTNFRQILE